jgi:hypothetical protein
MALSSCPLFTDTYENCSAFVPTPDSVYIFRRSVEPRSRHLDRWSHSPQNVRLWSIESEGRTELELTTHGERTTVSLRSEVQLRQLWTGVKDETVYIDITGLRHHVWAALLRSALRTRVRVAVVYVEPTDYRPSLTPTEGEIYDLSERIEGISPLPGFARLRDAGQRVCFVPLLGFEGTRLAYLIEQVEPPGEKIVPIVGVPGFRPEYPFTTYLGKPERTSCHKSLAECVFRAGELSV